MYTLLKELYMALLKERFLFVFQAERKKTWKTRMGWFGWVWFGWVWFWGFFVVGSFWGGGLVLFCFQNTFSI